MDLAKIVGLILGVLGIGTLTSCYGVAAAARPDPYTNDLGINVVFTGTIVGDTDGDGNVEPVPGIKLSSNYTKSTFSDVDGKFQVLAYFPDETVSKATISFTDIDGEENGSFENMELVQNKPNGYNPKEDYYYPETDDEYASVEGVINLGAIKLTNK